MSLKSSGFFGFFNKKNKVDKKQENIETSVKIPPEFLPTNIGIIMDGNGRWAKKRGLPRQAGHSYGAKTFRKIVKYCESVGVSVVTVYAFSTENWKRSSAEVKAIMKLLEEYLTESLLDFKDENIITRFIGDTAALSPKIRELIEEVEKSSEKRTGMILNIAINYGGREEITRAVKMISEQVLAGTLAIEDIDEDIVSNFMYTAGQPELDLILRPSGEFRTSNFMLWQSAYSELVFMDVLWPDFTEQDMHLALIEYAKRDRRFGGV